MKFIFFSIFLAFITCNLYCSDILQADLKKGRVSEIFSNKVLVRLKPGYDIFEKEKILHKELETKVQYLLHPNSSLTYNTKNRNKIEEKLLSSKLYAEEEMLLRSFVVYYDGSIEPEEYCRRLLLSNPAVELAEPYYVPKLMSYIPNDTYIQNQDDVLKLIHAYDAWDIEKGNPDVITGISDSGTNQNHQDINGNLGINLAEIPDDGQDNDGNGYIDDYNGYNFSWKNTGQEAGDTYNNSEIHGQQVAGIVGAAADNSTGIAGIGFKCRIFPLKIIENGSLEYSYESIIYAAIRGLKVINCSWGTVKPFSEFDQSVINYAISRDVSIVSAAGNLKGNITKYDVFYPAGYYGVLGVGEVNINDRLTGESLASGCRILAPGSGNYSTTNSGYFEVSSGTSYASPVVAGAVALARSKYPQLSGLQAIEFVRQAVDRHDNFSPNDKKLIPGRVNLLKCVSTDPFSIPGILPEKYIYTDNTGAETDRFKSGDKAFLKIRAMNVLGNANNLKFVLSVAYDPSGAVTIEDSIFNLASAVTGEKIDISGFSLRINQNYTGNVILRVDITGENGYFDFFKFDFIPVRRITTFSNDEIKLSLSDYGEFGFSTVTKNVAGVGFNYRDFGNQIYRNSSVMVSAEPDKLVYNSNNNQKYYFESVKNFISPNQNTGIYNDSKADTNKIGVEITQKISFPGLKSKAARLDFKMKNISGNVIQSPALGLFIDWDIGKDADFNSTKYLPSAIPEGFSSENTAAEEAYSTTANYPVFGSAAYSSEPDIEPFAAGLSNDYNLNYSKSRRFETMNSGIDFQSSDVADIGATVGIKFNGAWQPDVIKECVICIGAGDNEIDLAQQLKDCILNIPSYVKDNSALSEMIFTFPNPANDIIYLKALKNADIIKYSLINIMGNVVVPEKSFNNLKEGEVLGMDISGLAVGIYLLEYSINGYRELKKIIVYR